MERITKAKVARLLTNNHSAFIYAGLRPKLTFEEIFEVAKQVPITDNRTAKAKGMRLVFSNDSILNLNDYRNKDYDSCKFMKDGNYIMLYEASKANWRCNFDSEHIIIYYIYEKDE